MPNPETIFKNEIIPTLNANCSKAVGNPIRIKSFIISKRNSNFSLKSKYKTLFLDNTYRKFNDMAITLLNAVEIAAPVTPSMGKPSKP